MEAAKSVLEKYGQQHLLKFWNDLSDNEKENLLHDINDIDLKEVTEYFSVATTNNSIEKLDSLLEPIPKDSYGSVSRSNEKELSLLEDSGLKQISDGKVGALLLAGGQGTRLGVNYPKGMYDVGLPSHKPLFQIQAERIRKLQQLAEDRYGKRCYITWYIMTSDATMESTQKFFEKNNYFGLNKDNIYMFEQGMLPCFNFEGKILLDEKHKISKSPDGNGGLYRALREKNILQDMQQRGIKYLHAYSVDNILVKVADPVFIGFVVKKGADCAAKVVEKTVPTEAVGVVCCVNGVYQVVEYSEITLETASRQDPDGRLTFNAGNICNHLFTTDFLLNVANEFESKLRLHVANKKIPYINAEGKRIKPEEPNGIKIEKFVFDVFPFAKNFVTWEVPRDAEFSGIKNSESCPKDNAATARQAIDRLHRKYIEAAGGIITGEGIIEISPLLSYAGEGLKAVVEGKTFQAPLNLTEEGLTLNGYH